MNNIDFRTGFILLALTGLVSCSGGKKNTETAVAEVLPDDIVEMRADQIKLAGIETGTISMHDISTTLRVNGIVTVAPQNQATICSPMGGFVKSITLVPGSSVKKGEVLAIIENQDFVDLQENYLEAKNKFEFSKADFARHTELYKNDVYSAQNLQQVTTDYNILKAQVNAFEQKLAIIGVDYTKLTEDNISRSFSILSPISGSVRFVNVNSGKYVAPADVLFEIVNCDKLLLELTLFEKDAGKAVIGQDIRFFINNEDESHKAVIYETGKSINPDRSYKVFARVESVCPNLMPGMYVSATIETSKKSVVAVPSESMVSFDDKFYIFIFGRDKTEKGLQFTEYKMVEVQKGDSDSGFTQVILPAGFDLVSSKCVLKGAYNLLSAKKNAGEMAC
jgi:membrane fusion protein, heavy metal efflux system